MQDGLILSIVSRHCGHQCKLENLGRLGNWFRFYIHKYNPMSKLSGAVERLLIQKDSDMWIPIPVLLTSYMHVVASKLLWASISSHVKQAGRTISKRNWFHRILKKTALFELFFFWKAYTHFECWFNNYTKMNFYLKYTILVMWPNSLNFL